MANNNFWGDYAPKTEPIDARRVVYACTHLGGFVDRQVIVDDLQALDAAGNPDLAATYVPGMSGLDYSGTRVIDFDGSLVKIDEGGLGVLPSEEVVGTVGISETIDLMELENNNG